MPWSWKADHRFVITLVITDLAVYSSMVYSIRYILSIYANAFSMLEVLDDYCAINLLTYLLTYGFNGTTA